MPSQQYFFVRINSPKLNYFYESCDFYEKSTGSNLVQVKRHNQALVLKLICTNPPMSRSELAGISGLTKMTLSNIISELIEGGFIAESQSHVRGAGPSVGRRPILLDLADSSPCVCGMLIKRGLLQVILADLKARVIDSVEIRYDSFDSADALIQALLGAYGQLKERNDRRIVAVSVSALGPVDIHSGMLLNTTNFYGLSNIPISQMIGKATGLPTFLINDASAGALAEQLYGQAQNLQNFLYLHFMNGIGAGAVLDNVLYEGDCGQGFEFGHTSISYSGPKCSCGNTGCLELYASVDRMNEQTAALKHLYPDSMLLRSGGQPTWDDYVTGADRRDPLAMIVLDRFCEYVSYALTSLLNNLDVTNVIVGYDGKGSNSFIESAISSRVNRSAMLSAYRHIAVSHSVLGGSGPLIGSIAAVASRIFSLNFSEGEGDEQLLQMVYPSLYPHADPEVPKKKGESSNES